MRRETSLGIALLLSGALGCASKPIPLVYPVWVNWEGRTAAFSQSRNYVTSSCQVLKREECPQELRSNLELREQAKTIGANTVLVERRESGTLERTSFYVCPTMPNGDLQGPLGPDRSAPTK